MDSVLRGELRHSMDFGAGVLDPEEIQRRLEEKFNRVEIRRIDRQQQKRVTDIEFEESKE